MNLLHSHWLPFRLQDGHIEHGPPARIADPQVVDVAFPRADFDGAAWQFLIGLLQTTAAPEDHEDWAAWWGTPPEVQTLQARFEPCEGAFEVFGDGPRFMQELDPPAELRKSSVASLLIDAPGDQGIKYNTDHFVKRGAGEQMCPRCAAMALFTMQVNAPSGGKGYRTGLRGGGPLTTLVVPPGDEEPLWRKLWLNVLPDPNLTLDSASAAVDYSDWRLFPWLGKTRVSEQAGSETTAADVHPLHVYWAMPRRFQLLREEEPCRCDVCGEPSEQRVREVRTTNYGYNYSGPWRHPLTPYRFNPNKPQEDPISIKGQQGGLGYRHWESLVLEDHEQRGNLPALVVRDYPGKARELSAGVPGQQRARLWVFGYDMDNMKPRGWYATHMPLVAVPEEGGLRERFLNWVDTMIAAADNAASQLRGQVKAAWYNRPKDASGDFTFIDLRFWEATEEPFYNALTALADTVAGADEGLMPPAIAASWYRTVWQQALAVFDALVLDGDAGAAAMRRVITARNTLQRKVLGTREMKQLRAWAQLNQPAGSPAATATATADAGETP